MFDYRSNNTKKIIAKIETTNKKKLKCDASKNKLKIDVIFDAKSIF